MTNSSTSQVLATKGNQALIAADKTVSDLLPGQLGFFNADTRMSITDAATAALANRILIAVGIDTNNDGEMDDVRFQAGECIQTFNKETHHLNYTPASAGKGQKFTISGIKANCDTEYILKVGFTGPALMELNATNPISKAYTVKTSCCDDCEAGCGKGDCIELITKLVTELNNDDENIFSAFVADPATGDEITDMAAFITANPDVCPNIVLEGNVREIQAKCGFNFNYDKVRDVVLSVFLTEGFNCTGTVTEDEAYVAETGNPYDIKQFETVAQGYTDGSAPGRMYQNGVQKQYTSIVENVKYDTFWLTYDYQIGSGSGRDRTNPMQTMIAVPEEDTATRDAIAGLFAFIYPNFDALADDVAAASTDPTVTEPEVASVDTDGIAG